MTDQRDKIGGLPPNCKPNLKNRTRSKNAYLCVANKIKLKDIFQKMAKNKIAQKRMQIILYKKIQMTIFCCSEKGTFVC
jgi:hypothetical protein